MSSSTFSSRNFRRSRILHSQRLIVKSTLLNNIFPTTQLEMIRRHIVTLPKKLNHDSLGSSKSLALKRFYSSEKRLLKNPELRQDYNQFMAEYESLGHMRPAAPSLNNVLSHSTSLRPLVPLPSYELYLMPQPLPLQDSH